MTGGKPIITAFPHKATRQVRAVEQIRMCAAGAGTAIGTACALRKEKTTGLMGAQMIMVSAARLPQRLELLGFWFLSF
jgi:argininosuccinate lyase